MRQHPAGFGPCGERARQRRVYDRAKARGRKRQRGGDGRLPDGIRHWFTDGERAVLSVIGWECKKRGKCELKVERIASLAGVSIRLVQYAISTASWCAADVRALPEKDRVPLLIAVKRRPRGVNTITIVSRAWINWLEYRRSEAPAVEAAEDGDWTIFDAFGARLPGHGCKKVHTSEKPKFLDVEAASVSDGWQRLRLGLPLQRGLGEGERTRSDHGLPGSAPDG